MERYEIVVDDEGNYCGLIPSENGSVVKYADAQATVEALQRERDELKELTSVVCGHCCEPMAIPSKAVLQAALDAERERSEKQAEEAMVVFSKLSQLQALVRALPCLDGEIKVKTYHHESERGQEWDEYECGDAGFDNLEAANVYAALLRYRAALDATTPAHIDAAETHDRMFNHTDRHPEAL